MNDELNFTEKSQRLTRESHRRKILAFVFTSCTCFLIAALLWPISVSGFRSHTAVSIPVDANVAPGQDVNSELADVVSQFTTDARLSQLVQRVSNSHPLKSSSLADLDLNSIRNAISINVLPADTAGKLKVGFSFDGTGSRDEQILIKELAGDLSQGMSLALNGSNQIAVSNSAADNIEQLKWLMSQFETDINEVRGSLDQIQNPRNGDSPFRNASHRKPVATVDSVRESIESIDTQSLRNAIDSLEGLTISSAASPLTAVAVTDQKIDMLPIDGIPTSRELAIVGLLSLVFGSVVGLGYRPYADRGFDSVSKIASLLGVPVVAALPKQKQETTEGIEELIPLANRVVSVAKLVLLGLLIMTIGFCLVSTEVREALFSNPFLGFSKMVWMFTGS